MDGLLTPISQTYLNPRTSEPLFKESRKESIKSASRLSTAEDALELLKGEPDYETLIHILTSIAPPRCKIPGFNIQTPSPQSAQIVTTLVTDIVPNYWAILKESGEPETPGPGRWRNDLALLLACLRSITGLNSITVRMKAIIQETKESVGSVGRSEASLNLGILLNLLETLLDGHETVLALWRAATARLENAARRRALFHEFSSLIAGGRLVSVAAEADNADKQSSSEPRRWVGDGLEYSKWLGTNLCHWIRNITLEDDAKLCAELFTKSLRLGYPGMSDNDMS
jgi:telomere length regulation protein